MRILVVEDEKTLCTSIANGLRIDGYEVDTCFNGDDAWDMALSESYDLIILDLNLPGMDGMDVLRSIREEDSETGILILSARGQLQDKIDGLDNGANDYLCKPFHFEELEARVRSLTRRRVVQNNLVLECGELALDTKARTVSARGTVFSLTCVGCKCRQLQQLYPRAYFSSSKKIESSIGIRPYCESCRTRVYHRRGACLNEETTFPSVETHLHHCLYHHNILPFRQLFYQQIRNALLR